MLAVTLLLASLLPWYADLETRPGARLDDEHPGRRLLYVWDSPWWSGAVVLGLVASLLCARAGRGSFTRRSTLAVPAAVGALPIPLLCSPSVWLSGGGGGEVFSVAYDPGPVETGWRPAATVALLELLVILAATVRAAVPARRSTR